MPAEKVEDKIARIVNEAISARDKRQSEEKDPNKAWLRSAIREEVAAALEGLMGEGKEGGQGRRQRASGGEGGEGEEGDSIIKSLFG